MESKSSPGNNHIFERGFKSWCENSSESLRKKLGLNSTDPLSPYFLAQKMGLNVIEMENVLGLSAETKKYLSSTDGDEWSAVTVTVNNNSTIVVNPSHSIARKNSSLMHELAHVLRGHKPGQLIMSDGFVYRQFDPLQEAEADWFAGSLLLPRIALSRCTFRGMSEEEITEKYEVSTDLVRYRTNVLGIKKQFKRRY